MIHLSFIWSRSGIFYRLFGWNCFNTAISALNLAIILNPIQINNGFLIRIAVLGGDGFVSCFSACFVLGKDAVTDSDTGNGFVAVCRFDQGAAVEGAGVGFLKNLVLNILFQMKERLSEKQTWFQTAFDQI